ncbi:MAG: septum formation protein Maf [Lentisphaeria bacterium]|nr:Maf family protein [Lentisphaeria bacterium]NQZ68433.1 septum formation protein Maf [Lentisphaeria bacterium]
MRLILASQSPRRKEILTQAGFNFEIISADIDETVLPGELPDALVLRLAKEKAEAVFSGNTDATIIAADTIVCIGKRILNKPVDMKEAREMIEYLSGKTHRVLTAVAVFKDGEKETWISESQVTFNVLSEETIDYYMSIASPLDKAGAYAIQEHEELLVEKFEGLYSNVVGLPIEELVQRLPLQ